MAFSFSWFSPAGLTLSAFVAGLSGSIFAFWGWDTALTVNEETKDSDKTPGRAALLCVVSILCTYLLVAVAMHMYAGVGANGLGLGNEEISDNVFGALAEPVLGSPLVPVPVPRRGRLERREPDHHVPADVAHPAGDGHLQGDPAAVRHRPSPVPDPVLRDGAAASARRCSTRSLTFTSENVLPDTIYSIGIMICFYYGLTAFACVWYFRHELFTTPRASCSSSCSRCSAGSGCSSSSWSRCATALAGLRQRRIHRRRRPGASSSGSG